MLLTRRALWAALALALPVVLLPGAFWWWVGLLAALTAADVLLCASPRRITVTREPVRPIRLDEHAEAVTVLHNAGRRRLRGYARDGWQPSARAQQPLHPVSIDPGEALQIRTRLTPVRRGHLRSEHIAVRSLGPLGIAGRQVTHRVPQTLRILPPFRSRKHLPSALRRIRELDGSSAARSLGAGTEFDSLRDYVRGDDVRSIDWRATARRRAGGADRGEHLVVRTWRPERERRVILCLDASRTSAVRIGDEPRIETSIEAAMLLGTLAVSAGDRTDLTAFHREQVARASSAAAGSFSHHMAEQLASVQPALVEADFSQLPARVAEVSTRHALVVVLTALDAGAVLEGLLPVLPTLASQHTVVVASPQDPELQARLDARQSVSDVYSAAAAERQLYESAAVRDELTAVGAEVVEAPPRQLPAALADTYIRLKAEGRL
ncbi:DUF58 domain-containing protein [Nesterenkonia sp. NBAIMH1]|uniref:DUF58 domain-containing protein n=1 Tax=Nesterenkonia sp. NBAIMH1 TaxID=2600320 RepID=UPI0011B7FFA2|nr:DUF58 domain-containing protein [Nesterenkonia sp. NBAIMH1]